MIDSPPNKQVKLVFEYEKTYLGQVQSASLGHLPEIPNNVVFAYPKQYESHPYYGYDLDEGLHCQNPFAVVPNEMKHIV